MSKKFEKETEIRQFTVRMPLYVFLSKTRKPKYINLNTFRNLVGQENNNMKIAYKKLVKELYDKGLIPNDIYFDKYEVIFILNPVTKRRRDLDNVLSITSKFFVDAIVELGVVNDDVHFNLGRLEMLMGRYYKYEELEDELFYEFFNEGFVEITVKEVLENKEA